MRCYSELITFPTFQERFEYLKLNGSVGRATFGHMRYLNQTLYTKSKEWKNLRKKIIIRDNGNDMAMEGYPVADRGQIHHLNPITPEMILDRDPLIFDPENLILVSLATHNAIHYQTEYHVADNPIVRKPNDQCPWLT